MFNLGQRQRPGNASQPLWGAGARAGRGVEVSLGRDPGSRSQNRVLGDLTVASFSGLGFVPRGQASVSPKGSLVCSVHVSVTFLGG